MSETSSKSVLKTARQITSRCSRSFCLSALLILAAAAAHAQTIFVNQTPVSVTLAVTPQEQQKGLQGVNALDQNQGMLFVFNPARSICMWMKDVPIDLDVGFFNEKGTLFAIRRMKAQTETNHCSYRQAAWALEVNAGWFEKNKLTEGAKLRFEKGPED